MNCPQPRKTGWSEAAFTLMELLVVMACLALLGGTLLASLSGSREPGRRASCLNNLRQVGLAELLYVDESEDHHYPRRASPVLWTIGLRDYFKEPRLLCCPADLGAAINLAQVDLPHSYILNAWDDYFDTVLSYQEMHDFLLVPPYGTNGMPASVIRHPSATVVFGEKVSSRGDHYMDLFLGDIGNENGMVDQSRHGQGAASGTKGGSNFAFADGSARFLKFGSSLQPENLWAVMDAWRTNQQGIPFQRTSQ